MKKVILLLVLILCTAIGAKQSSSSEKKEMLKQFEVFQNAVKNKDFETVKSMVQFPLNEEAGYAFITDENVNFENGVTEKMFSKYKSDVLGAMVEISSIKVDSSKNNLTSYYEEGVSAEDKKRKYYYDEDESSYYYKDKSNKKVYTGFCASSVEGSFSDDGDLEVASSSFPAKVAPALSESCDHSINYYFKLINGKLKLYKILVAG